MKKIENCMTEQQIKDKIKITLNQIIIASFNLKNGPVMKVMEATEKYSKEIQKLIGGK